MLLNALTAPRACCIMLHSPVTFSADEVAPEGRAVLAYQGMPAEQPASPAVDILCREALDILADLVRPAGLLRDIDADTFQRIYAGEGDNAPDTPLQHIYPKADRLALFAVTVGRAVSDRIDACFRDGDPALAAMLDAAASAAADGLTQRLAARARRALVDAHLLQSTDVVLPYSPGYCGWHVTGQKRLFAALRPEHIGITLTDTCLMIPIKSCSGVLVAGPRDLHVFQDTYPFCDTCRTHTCRERIANLFAD